jgi:predicted acylesterase/phospholipase RssA
MIFDPISNTDVKINGNLAIVNSGGGGRGEWQAGVHVLLSQIGIAEQAAVVIGTSVGALNTALLAKYGKRISLDDPSLIPQPYFTIADTWDDITKNSDIYKGALRTDGWGKFTALMSLISGQESLLDPTPLYERLKRIFGADTTMQELYCSAQTHIVVTASSLNAKQELFFASFGGTRDTKVYDALRASSAIPIAFKSVPVPTGGDKKDWCVDGGNGANNPFVAVNYFNKANPDKKIKKVIMVYTGPDKISASVGDFKSALSVALQGVETNLSTQEQIAELYAEYIVDTSDVDIMAIYPDEDTGDALDFSKRGLLQKGYDHAAKLQGYDYRTHETMSLIDFLAR